MEAIELRLFAARLQAVCDEMGVALRRAAFSPNIKDRLDFSCALFTPAGLLLAQAAHIPVHLGSMAFAMRSLVAGIDWQPGDVAIVNDPFLGGTHLPDVTVVTPVFAPGSYATPACATTADATTADASTPKDGMLIAFVVDRAHHANIGASEPGSMPVSRSLAE
jgi:N-methylhydantoinase B